MVFRRCTTRGAVASMLTGTLSSVVAIALSPTVMADIFHAEAALVPLKNPGIVSVLLSFLAGILVSLRWPEPAAFARFAEAEMRMHFGAGRSTQPVGPPAASPATPSVPDQRPAA